MHDFVFSIYIFLTKFWPLEFARTMKNLIERYLALFIRTYETCIGSGWDIEIWAFLQNKG